MMYKIKSQILAFQKKSTLIVLFTIDWASLWDQSF